MLEAHGVRGESSVCQEVVGVGGKSDHGIRKGGGIELFHQGPHRESKMRSNLIGHPRALGGDDCATEPQGLHQDVGRAQVVGNRVVADQHHVALLDALLVVRSYDKVVEKLDSGDLLKLLDDLRAAICGLDEKFIVRMAGGDSGSAVGLDGLRQEAEALVGSAIADEAKSQGPFGCRRGSLHFRKAGGVD